MTWIHGCVSIDSNLNHLTVVVNGQKLEDKSFPIPPGTEHPTNLTGKLLLFKRYIGFWYQCKHKVSNLNIFSKRLSLPEMVIRTSGNNCGKADGDYLAWENSEWVLKGEASMGEVKEEDLCRRASKIQLFTAPVGALDQCQNLCPKVQKGMMATMQSPGKMKAYLERIDEVLFPSGFPNEAGTITPAAWAPIRQTSGGSWVDLYTERAVEDLVWVKGYPTEELCAIYIVPWKGLGSFACDVNTKVNPRYCPCHFPIHPYLTLRGLCPDSHGFSLLLWHPQDHRQI